LSSSSVSEFLKAEMLINLASFSVVSLAIVGLIFGGAEDLFAAGRGGGGGHFDGFDGGGHFGGFGAVAILEASAASILADRVSRDPILAVWAGRVLGEDILVLGADR
jgi:hypothetical protein